MLLAYNRSLFHPQCIEFLSLVLQDLLFSSECQKLATESILGIYLGTMEVCPIQCSCRVTESGSCCIGAGLADTENCPLPLGTGV